jgi:N-methylhydantoinase A
MGNGDHGAAGGLLVACDTGGTFTDLVAVDPAGGRVEMRKTPSTPPDFSSGVVGGLEALAMDATTERFFHSTTVTTNAVVARTGAPCALVTTRGFRDVLEIRRANRGDLYDILWDPPPPFVPRRHRFELDERIDYSGAVIEELDASSARSIGRQIVARGLRTVAVCLINSYVNPTHERRLRELLAEVDPTLEVFLSVDVLPEPPEFERTATTVANAYLAPVLSGYIAGLAERLDEHGVSPEQIRVMHNGAGTMSTEQAAELPVKTLNSGPAAGVAAAAAIATALDRRDVVSLDIGGTSADIGVVRDGRPALTRDFDLEWGMPIRFPSVDVLSIGAGGGSIAALDRVGYLRVGPGSAGAVPGPASYGRGGELPTNTDAQLVLGRIVTADDLGDEAPRAGFALDPELAEAAIEERIAKPLGISLVAAAEGIVRVANANMLKALRLTTVERGLDPRRFSLLVSGGAGPLHGVELARALQMPEVIVPPHPGMMNAIGLLFLEPIADLSAAFIEELDGLDDELLRDRLADLEAQARQALAAQGVEDGAISLERRIDMRYVGQLHSLTVELAEPDREGLAEAAVAFHAEHQRAFRYAHPDAPVELSALRITARGPHDPPAVESLRMPVSHGHGGGTKRAFFAECGWVDTPIVDRDRLAVEETVSGPALAVGFDSTTVLPPGATARVDERGCLIVSCA